MYVAKSRHWDSTMTCMAMLVDLIHIVATQAHCIAFTLQYQWKGLFAVMHLWYFVHPELIWLAREPVDRSSSQRSTDRCTPHNGSCYRNITIAYFKSSAAGIYQQLAFQNPRAACSRNSIAWRQIYGAYLSQSARKKDEASNLLKTYPPARYS